MEQHHNSAIKAILTKGQLRQPMGIFLKSSLPLILASASAHIDDFKKRFGKVSYQADGPITPHLLVHAKAIVTAFNTSLDKKSYCQLDFKDMESFVSPSLSKILFGDDRCGVTYYLINSYDGCYRNLTPNRKRLLIGLLQGSIDMPTQMSKSKINEILDQAKSFQLISLTEVQDRNEMNPFYKRLQTNSSSSSPSTRIMLSLHSLSKTFYHNGNVDEEMIALLHLLGHINLDLIEQSLHAHKKPGCPRKDTGWADIFS
jgi:hypothetical protein